MAQKTKKQKNMQKLAIEIVRKLHTAGFEAYLVGGCVRDMIMGLEPEDYDIATNARTDDVRKLFKKIVPVGIQFGVMLVIKDGIEFEVATFRSDGIYLDGRHPQTVHFSSAKEDAQRRDFTINGLFYDPVKKKIIDFVDGEKDIKRKIVRTIGDPHKRFAEDKLRIMRGIRFATRFEYTLDEKTKEAIKNCASHVKDVSMERIRDELVKMMTGLHPGKSLRLMDEVGLLSEILPEVAAMKGVEQPPKFHPEGDVFIHTMLMMDYLHYPSLVLSFSTLLHDVGKPPTVNKETLRCPFHSDVGAELTEKILKRLRFSNNDIEQIRWCVGNHMNFMHVQNMRIGKLKRLMLRNTFHEELELHRIDCSASHGMLDNYEFLLEKEEEFKKEDLKPKPLINGHNLIALGFEPGPLFSEILDESWNLQLEHKLKDRDEAIQWAMEYYKKKGVASREKRVERGKKKKEKGKK